MIFKKIVTHSISVYFIIPVFLLCVGNAQAQFQNLRKIDPTTLNDISKTSIKSTSRVLAVKFSPDGQNLFVGGLDKKISVYKISDGSLVWSVEGAQYEPIASVNVNGEMPLLIVAQNAYVGGSIVVFRWDTGENLGALSPYAGGRNGLGFDAPNSRLGWVGPNGKVFEFDFANGAMSTNTGWAHHPEKAFALTYDPLSNIYSSGSDGKVVKGNKDDSPEEIMSFGKPSLVVTANHYISGTNTNEILIAASDNSGKLNVLNPTTGEIIFTQTLTQDFSGLRFHPTDPDILVATSAGTIYVYNIRTGATLKQVKASDQEIWSLDVSLDGKRIAVGLEKGEVKMYEMQ